jgi:orotate phosphoribosyltransferase
MRASQRAKPLRSAARMPFTLTVMTRMRPAKKALECTRCAGCGPAAEDAEDAPRGDRAGRAILARNPRKIMAMSNFRQDFLAFSLAREVLRFGEFITKAGRRSPYFFNAGLFNDGDSLRRLGAFYADALLASGVACDQIFGPAYKGIPLAAATAVALAEKGHNLPFSFNRKEAKDHGEGGVVVGAPLRGRVLIVDDVITAGTSVRESVDLISAHGANPAGVLIALDRMERGQGTQSAVAEVRSTYGIPVVAIATLDDLMAFLADRPELAQHAGAVEAYRAQYGAT